MAASNGLLYSIVDFCNNVSKINLRTLFFLVEHCSIFVSAMQIQSTYKMDNGQITQIDKANAALMELAVNVTTSDRNEAKKTFSEFTIVQYLKGRGKDIDTAVTLLEFFRKRISARDRLIA